jgi:hypothetical protein
MNTTTTTKFNYEVFDRQMITLIEMSYHFIYNYEDHVFLENVIDLRSLCMKAARLCRMTDQDLALQQEDFTHHRRTKNQDYVAELPLLINEFFSFMMKTLKEASKSDTIVKENPLLYIEGISELLPTIGKWLETNEEMKGTYECLTSLNGKVEKALKKSTSQKIYPEISSKDHSTDFLHYYNMLTYLMLHFERMMEITGATVTPEEAERLLTSGVQMHRQSEEGQEEMRHYTSMLHYMYADGMSAEDLKAELRKLVNDVPQSLQTAFMGHADRLDLLGMDLRELPTLPNEEEIDALFSALCKYQWLSELIYQLEHPEDSDTILYNKVFHTSLNGRPVDLVWLREKIGQMIGIASRKNHWFCIYSVLKYHNYIKDQTAKYFAEQMQHPDWFPQLSKELQFNGDTLTEYNGYLSVTNFTIWNQKDFDRYRTLHHKTKWSPHLWRKFQNLCYSMNEVFR